MAIEKMGVFTTPKELTHFGAVEVFDFRAAESNVAQWYVLRHPNLRTVFVLMDSEEKPIGRYVQGGKYLKWNLSINVHEHVFMAQWWPGRDTSRTGQHGTQHYAYLATDLRDMDEFALSGGAYRGSLGMDDFVSESSSAFPMPRSGYNMDEEWHGVTLKYFCAYSVVSGYSTDHMRQTYRRVPARSVLCFDGEAYDLGDERDYDTVAQAIREKVPYLSEELQEALLVEDAIRDSAHVKQLFHFYLKRDDDEECANHEVIALYAERKAKDETDVSDGVLFDFTGHFRRMGAANNGDLWVIQPDGSLREPDELERRKSYPEGDVRWKRVEPDEVALRWYCPLNCRPWERSIYEVAQKPVGALTDAQKEAVKKIEREIQEVVGEGIGKFLCQLTGEGQKNSSHQSSRIVYSAGGAVGSPSPFAVLARLKKG